MGILKQAGVGRTIDELRRSASGGGRSGRSAQLFLKPDSAIKVRFLQEPTQFMEYLEHYDKAKNSFVPAIDDDPLDQHPDEATRKTSKRWLANVLTIEDGRVHIVKLNPDQMNRLLARYQRNNTLLDRNYELIRNGSGRDTKYDVDNDDPTNMDLSRFTSRMHDLEDYLYGEVDEYHGTSYQAKYRQAKENGGQSQPAAQSPPESPPVAPAPVPETQPLTEAIQQAVAPSTEAQAQKTAELDEKYGATPPWEETPPPPGPATTGGPGMAEVAAETEAAKLQAVPDPAPPAEVDPWAQAKENGQPCVKGENDTCVICGFPVTECLMAK